MQTTNLRFDRRVAEIHDDSYTCDFVEWLQDPETDSDGHHIELTGFASLMADMAETYRRKADEADGFDEYLTSYVKANEASHLCDSAVVQF